MRIGIYNRRAVEMLDLTPDLMASAKTLEDLIRFQVRRGDITPVEDAESVGSDEESQVAYWMNRSVSTRVPVSYERTDRHGRTLEIRTVPLPEGGWVRTYTDVTERKAQEDQLKDREERLRSYLDLSPLAVAIFRKGKSIYANARYADMFGIPRDQIIGFDGRSLAADPNQAEEVVATFLRDGYVRDREMLFKRLDGSTFWALISLEPTEFDGKRAHFAWAYDITAQKEAENRLRGSEARSRAWLDASPIACAIYRKGRVVFGNRRFTSMFGVPADEIVGTEGTTLFADPSDAARLNDRLKAGGRVTDA
jgi:PAS domain S-box-containing protein